MKEILSSLNRYLSGFSDNGYSREKAREILDLCQRGNTSPLSHVIRTFECNRFDTAGIIAGLLFSVSSEAAETASSLFGVRRGSLSPEVIAALFFGTRDILPFASSLSEYSPLSRLMSGTRCTACAEMQLLPFVVDYLINGVIFDEAFLYEEEMAELVPLPSQKKTIDEISSLIAHQDTADPFVVRVIGEYGSGRRSCIQKALKENGLSCVFLNPGDGTEQNDVSLLSAKLLLSERIPVLINDSLPEKLLRKLSDEAGLLFLLSERNKEGPTSTLPSVSIELSPPSLAEQYLFWQHETEGMKLSSGIDLSAIAGEFEMNPGSIRQALHFAKMFSKEDPITEEDIRKGCNRSFHTDMGSKAIKLPRYYGWDDIILPPNSLRMLNEACQQARLRHKVLQQWGFQKKMPYGNGVSMIFTGPPGTGKTMAAQIMASELGMDIYKISLANVVSKYIGETEKNLNEIFDKAKRCKAILFFDEADVLFSKRTEVKESNDKYSNMESAFLLQKTEEYNGIVILATNFIQNFDEAFKRRMRFLIDFPLPDAVLRRELWNRAFPAEAPKDSIDFDYLSERFPLSGSNIRNIALHSAYLAAGENEASIGMKHIIPAIRNEYAKIGKSFTQTDAGEYYFDLPQLFRRE